MKPPVVALAFVLSISVTAASGEPFAAPIFTVVMRGGGLGFDYNEVTVFSTIWGAPSGDKLGSVWIAERRRHDRKMRETVVDHQWIDGRTCPALRPALQAIADLPPMRFGSPGDIGMSGLAFDVPLTMLRGLPAKDGGGGTQISRAEYVGPLPDWRNNMEARIANCWRDAPATIPGVSIREQLASEADAEAWAH